MFFFRYGILGHRSSNCSIPTNNSVKRKVATFMGEGGGTGASVRDDKHTTMLVMSPIVWMLLWRLMVTSWWSNE